MIICSTIPIKGLIRYDKIRARRGNKIELIRKHSCKDISVLATDCKKQGLSLLNRDNLKINRKGNTGCLKQVCMKSANRYNRTFLDTANY